MKPDFRPRLNPALRFHIADGGDVLLVAERGHKVLSGSSYRVLIPLIDGQRTLGELVEVSQRTMTPSAVRRAIERMLARGYVVEADAEPAEASFWASLGVAASAVRGRLEIARVQLLSSGGASTDELARALRRAGVSAEHTSSPVTGEAFDLTVVVTDDYQRPELAVFNDSLLAAGRKWLITRLVGSRLWLGPLFIPGTTGCYACLEHRLRNNQITQRYLTRATGESAPFAPAMEALDGTRDLAASWTALEVMRVLQDPERALTKGAILTFDLRSYETKAHTLTRRPQCPACGDPSYYVERSKLPITLRSRRRVHNSAGARAMPAERLLQLHARHVSQITGVVPYIEPVPMSKALADADIDGLVGAVHNYASGVNMAFIHDDLLGVREDARSVTSGKGASAIQARASALGEALERYSAIFEGNEPVEVATYAEVAADTFAPETYLQFSPAQYANRDEWNSRPTLGHHWIPSRFPLEAPIEWTRVWSLTERCWRLLPTDFLYFRGNCVAEPFCAVDTNGNAAGSTLEDAILQGLLEVIERDAVALWWYNRARRPAVDLAALDEPYVHRLVEFHASIDRDLWVLDITTDVGVPTVAAVSRRSSKDPEDILVGFASHLDPRIAVCRAVTEVNQLLPAVFDAVGLSGYAASPASTAWFTSATVARESWLAPRSAAPVILADGSTRDIAEDVRGLVQRLARLDHEVLVLDLTRPDIGLPVVKVVVPGLRHFWRRLAPGRLYTVPVELGWIDEPTLEDAMNEHSVFI